MPRYRPVLATDSATRETLPLDTIVTILPRQSKRSGAKNNVHSQELADHELLDLAVWHGFQPDHVRIDKRDMGISANTTTINDRPALRDWLRETLPSGVSRVVVFSQEDRAFRDEEEVELNTFIREVKRHRGWVICGHKVYRLWEEYDADMFRMECKYAAKYIVHQVRGRLLPAIGRAAQRGLYDGRGINVGYIVDYDPKSPTYKHFIPYRPHADLVLHEIFERFARMPYPSVPALVRAWNASNGMDPVVDPMTGKSRIIPTLYFLTVSPEIDSRIWNRQSWGRRRAFPPYGIDDPLRRGWLLHEQGARRMLANVFYIGWVARDGIIIRGERLENGQVRVDSKCPPLVLHEPIVQDPELFWYCFERVSPYTIEGTPNPRRRFYSQGPREKNNDNVQARFVNPYLTTRRNAESQTLLLLGKVQCGIHGHMLSRFRRRPDEADYYLCKYYDEALGHRQKYCMYLRGETIDRAVVQEFLGRLELTEEDVHSIARAWQTQQHRTEMEAVTPPGLTRATEIETQLGNLSAAIAQTSVDTVRERLVEDMEKLTRELEHIRAQVSDQEKRAVQQATGPLSVTSLRTAKKTVQIVNTLRQKWHLASIGSRQALMQWVIESVTLTSDAHERRRLYGSITWRGGAMSPIEITRAYDRRQTWDAREIEVPRLWYPTARWSDLQALLPGRSRESMTMLTMRTRLPQRARHSMYWRTIPEAEMNRLAPSHQGDAVQSLAETNIQSKAKRSSTANLPAELLLSIAGEYAHSQT